MARMRSVKPEFWDDEELAVAVPRDARLLYIGLWNLADEHGRLRGDPRYIKGKVFAYDDDMTPGVIEVLLTALTRAARVVRYRVSGGQYLFLPKLAKHQRLEPDKVPSRLPGPEEADPEPPPEQPKHAGANKSAPDSDESALARARLLSMEHVAGGIEQVVPPSAGALALVPSVAAPRVDSAQTLLAEWLDHCRKRPPGTVIGQVGKQLKAMLAEGIDHADVRTGLAEWWRKGLHPSALPSVVNELMNASPARASPQQATSDQRFAQAKEAGRIAQAKFDAAQRAKGVTA